MALTSPVTLWAVLKSVAYAWQQQSLTDDAKQLFDLSRELYERFSTLGDYAIKLGTQITKTVSAYNKFASQFGTPCVAHRSQAAKNRTDQDHRGSTDHRIR